MLQSLWFKFWGNNRLIQWFKSIYIYLILVAIYLPLIVVVFLSFTDPSKKGNIVTNYHENWNWNNGSNYHKLFFDPSYYGNFKSGLLNSLVIGLIVTPISLIIGVLTTFGIWKARVITQRLVLNSAKITIVNPDVITGISLVVFFVIAFLPMKINLGWFTIILAQISFTVPYVIVTIYPKMIKMNYNLVLSSYDLNHRRWSTFFQVVIPYLLPAILAAALIAFATSFDDFIITNLVKGRVTTFSTELYTMKKGIKSWAITFGALIILVSFFFLLLVTIFKVTKCHRFIRHSWTKLKYISQYRKQKLSKDPLNQIISLTE